MTLPFSSTLIAVLRSSAPADEDGWPEAIAGMTVVADAVPAVISSPGGRFTQAGSEQHIASFRLAAENCDLQETDMVMDEGTQDVYKVTWLQRRYGFGLDHIEAGMERVHGYAP